MFKSNKQSTERVIRFGIRKFNVGIASVAVASGLVLLGTSTAYANVNTGVSNEATPVLGINDSSANEESSRNIPESNTANQPVETTSNSKPTGVPESTTASDAVEGKDISNDINPSIELSHETTPVVVDNGDSLNAKIKFSAPSVKEGDYFTVKFSNEVDLTGITRPKDFDTSIWIEDSIRLAKGHYDSATNTVKFVITKEAEVLRNIEASKSFYVAVNRDIVKETSTITPTISIGNTSKQFSVPVRYNQIDSSKANAVNGLAVSSLITESNDKTKEITSVTFANINRVNVNNAIYTEKNLNNNVAQFNSNDTEVKVYRVPANVALDSSYHYDPSKLEDVTATYSPTYSGNQMKINFGNISDAFVIVTKNKTVTKANADNTMLVSSTMEGNVNGRIYTKSVANANRSITLAAPDEGGYNTADLPYALGDLVWNDTNRNGIQDEGESGIPNVKVSLFDDKGQIIATTTTNDKGQYYFSKVYNGTYKVKFETPEGFVSTKKAGTSDESKDSNGLETTVVIKNSNDWTIDSGFYKQSGDVVVKYVIKGTDTEIQSSQPVSVDEPIDTNYTSDTPILKPLEIPKDGKTYKLVGHKVGSAPESGKVNEEKHTKKFQKHQ